MTAIEDILEQYYKKHDTKDLANLFQAYMTEIGASKLDKRKKDSSNTYRIDGETTNWNRVECYYYRNQDDYEKYGKFEFCITLRKRAGDYLLIEVGNEKQEIKRPYEISCGKVVHFDKDLLTELVSKHPKLFSMMCDQMT